MPDEPYPEHVKLSAIKDQSQAVGEFVDWLHGVKHVRFVTDLEVTTEEICPTYGCQEGMIRRLDPKTGRGDWFDCENCDGTGLIPAQTDREVPFMVPIRDLLAEFFDIDQDRLEDEKRHMLEAQRELNRQVTEKEA